jgi:steroid delta-isomerase-like uncharacterized protein
MTNSTELLIKKYYETFNEKDMGQFLDLIHDQIVHDINQGPRETGKTEFIAFMNRMNRCYEEDIQDLVVFVADNGRRAAAEFTVHGRYIETDEGLPDAVGQPYTLAAGAFFEVEENKITRVSNYYNLPDWMNQVSALEMDEEE